MRITDLKNIAKQHKGWVIMASIAAVCLMSLGAFALLPHHSAMDQASEPIQFSTGSEQGAAPRLVDSGAPFSFAPLVERVSPAVVSVTVEQKIAADATAAANPNVPEPFRQFFKQFGQGAPAPQPRKAMSMGSGFIIDKSGLIVTNNHVIDNASKIKVKLPDGRTFDAKLIGTDAATDVALLKVNADKPLPTVEFGNDRSLRVGDWVIAVGNPFGLSNTVTAGIVSSIGRGDINQSQPYTDFIQIDAPINQGNSGGPTFDLRGQVVGMNSMIFSPTGGSVGIGFAIPATTVRDVVAQLQAHGKVSRGWLGVQIGVITPEIANALGMKEPKGAIIGKVVADGPAAKAGLRQGDVIVSVDGKPVDDPHDLQRRIAGIAAGQSAMLGVLRNDERLNVKAVIAPRNEEQVAASLNGEGASPNATATGKSLGMGLAALNDENRRSFGVDGEVHGVVVVKIDAESDAAEKGLQVGDVIATVSNRPVRTPQDVEKQVALAKAAGRKSVLLNVINQSGSYFVAVNIGK